MFFDAGRNVQRTPINPMDRATIISVYPREIMPPPNPTIAPAILDGKPVFKFPIHIPAAKNDDFQQYTVGPCSWFKELFGDDDTIQSFIEIPIPATEVARAFIDDWSVGLLGCNMGEKSPGLFYLPGEFSREQLVKNELFKIKLAEARMRQKNYFHELLKIADALFVRTNGMTNAIPDNCRWAAEYLGIKDKPWLADIRAAEVIQCKACGSLRDPKFPICPTCHNIVDPELYKSMGLITAEKK